jgi:hypothetical protein
MAVQSSGDRYLGLDTVARSAALADEIAGFGQVVGDVLNDGDADVGLGKQHGGGSAVAVPPDACEPAPATPATFPLSLS